MRRSHRFGRAVTAVVLASTALSTVADASQAASSPALVAAINDTEIVVPDNCTLADAIRATNALATVPGCANPNGVSVIRISRSISIGGRAGAYVNTIDGVTVAGAPTALPTITSSVSIYGDGDTGIYWSPLLGNFAKPRAMFVAATGDLSLRDVRLGGWSIRGSDAIAGAGSKGGTVLGGAIYAQGPIDLFGVHLFNNSATGGGGAPANTALHGSSGGDAFGGAIYSTANVRIASSVFSDNSVTGGSATPGVRCLVWSNCRNGVVRDPGNGGSAFGADLALGPAATAKINDSMFMTSQARGGNGTYGEQPPKAPDGIDGRDGTCVATDHSLASGRAGTDGTDGAPGESGGDAGHAAGVIYGGADVTITATSLLDSLAISGSAGIGSPPGLGGDGGDGGNGVACGSVFGNVWEGTWALPGDGGNNGVIWGHSGLPGQAVATVWAGGALNIYNSTISETAAKNSPDVVMDNWQDAADTARLTHVPVPANEGEYPWASYPGDLGCDSTADLNDKAIYSQNHLWYVLAAQPAGCSPDGAWGELSGDPSKPTTLGWFGIYYANPPKARTFGNDAFGPTTEQAFVSWNSFVSNVNQMVSVEPYRIYDPTIMRQVLTDSDGWMRGNVMQAPIVPIQGVPPSGTVCPRLISQGFNVVDGGCPSLANGRWNSVPGDFRTSGTPFPQIAEYQRTETGPYIVPSLNGGPNYLRTTHAPTLPSHARGVTSTMTHAFGTPGTPCDTAPAGSDLSVDLLRDGRNFARSRFCDAGAHQASDISAAVTVAAPAAPQAGYGPWSALVTVRINGVPEAIPTWCMSPITANTATCRSARGVPGDIRGQLSIAVNGPVTGVSYPGGFVNGATPIRTPLNSLDASGQYSVSFYVRFTPTAAGTATISATLDPGFGRPDAASRLTHAATLQTALPPVNDNWVGATALGGISGTTFGTNVGATEEPQEPDHAGVPGNTSIWYSFTAPYTGPLALDTCASNFDTTLALYVGSSVNQLGLVDQNDDSASCGGNGQQSKLNFGVFAGTRYTIAVDGKFGATGSVVLNWNSISVPVVWSSAEAARLTQLATYFGTTPAQLQHDSVALIAFLVGLSGDHTVTPWDPTPLGSDVTIWSSWSLADLPILQAVQDKFAINKVDAHRLGVAFIDFILALSGH